MNNFRALGFRFAKKCYSISFVEGTFEVALFRSRRGTLQPGIEGVRKRSCRDLVLVIAGFFGAPLSVMNIPALVTEVLREIRGRLLAYARN